METVETLIVGTGVIGLACARALARSGREVIVAEAEGQIGSVTSSRNSEVIHAGIYYPKGSLKARHCVAGRHALYRYCAERHILHSRCGKLIVACSESEADQLSAIATRAAANGVTDIVRLGAAEVRDLEPAVKCHGALLSPSTGILDSHAFMLSLQGEAEDAGAMIALNAPVMEARPRNGGFDISIAGDAPITIAARELINAAGHGAPKLARAVSGLPTGQVPRQFFARGVYFSLSGAGPFSRLIYPVPVPGGLGTHVTVDLQGRTKFGPDVEWIDGEDYAVDPARAVGFYAAIRRYWPELPDDALMPDYAGVRPKIAGPGKVDDFRIDGTERHGLPGYVGLYGIESPGLTASLSIAEQVRELLDAARGQPSRVSA